MRVAVLAVDGMFDSGLGIVLDVLGTANQLNTQVTDPADQEPTVPFELTPVGVGTEVRTGHGLRLTTTAWKEVVDDPPDLLVMPAIGIRDPDDVVAAVRDHEILQAVGEMHGAGVAMAAACSGTFFLAEAGILDGLVATTSWWLGPAFRRRYPEVDLDEARALAHTRDVTTAGAAFAHIDLAMHLVRTQSPALAGLVSRYLVVGDRPSQSAVAIPSAMADADPTVAAFERHVRSHLGAPIDIAEAARAIGVGERTLQRITAATLGMTPIAFVQQVRLEHAVHLLRTTNEPGQVIATAVGYRNLSTLRRLLRRHRGVTLSGVRSQARQS